MKIRTRRLGSRAGVVILASILCFTYFFYPRASLGEVELKVDLGIAEVISEVRKWWIDIIKRHDQIDNKNLRHSANSVAISYLKIAGLMEVYANEIEKYIFANKSKKKISESKKIYNIRSIYKELNKEITELKSSVDKLDKEWAISYVNTLDKIYSNIPARSLKVYESYKLIYNTKKTMQPIDDSQAERIVEELRELAKKARLISAEIASTLNR